MKRLSFEFPFIPLQVLFIAVQIGLSFYFCVWFSEFTRNGKTGRRHELQNRASEGER